MGLEAWVCLIWGPAGRRTLTQGEVTAPWPVVTEAFKLMQSQRDQPSINRFCSHRPPSLSLGLAEEVASAYYYYNYLLSIGPTLQPPQVVRPNLPPFYGEIHSTKTVSGHTETRPELCSAARGQSPGKYSTTLSANEVYLGPSLAPTNLAAGTQM